MTQLRIREAVRAERQPAPKHVDSRQDRWSRIHQVHQPSLSQVSDIEKDLESYKYVFSSRLCARYHFEKPNDRRALDLMNAAAKAVMTELPDITIAYGVSDEYR